MSYDPKQPSLIPLGTKKLGDTWNGQERRHNNRAPRRPDFKFQEVKLPTYASNDTKLRENGYYPANI